MRITLRLFYVTVELFGSGMQCCSFFLQLLGSLERLLHETLVPSHARLDASVFPKWSAGEITPITLSKTCIIPIREVQTWSIVLLPERLDHIRGDL